ncbi:MAG: amino acid permease, partial [Candidatus Dormiibacterota bacterium]
MAEERRKVGSVAYQEAGEGYFAKRGLKRHAAFWSLWSLGVAAVISGDFYGWNLGLSVGGFGGLLIANIVIVIMYYGLCFSIAEMSPALPHTGGAYSFARSAMGPWGGFVTGLAENMEYVITPAVVVGAMGLLMQAVVVSLFNVTGDPWWNSVITWFIVFYIIFVAINIRGIVATMRFSVVICFLALGILAFFFISVLLSGKFNPSLLVNIEPTKGNTSFLPFGIAGIFPAIPFAIWFYLA